MHLNIRRHLPARERSGLYRKPHRIFADPPLKSHGFSIRVLGYNKRVISVADMLSFTCIWAWGESPMKRAVLYLRVSTVEQTTANQERELSDVAARMGCEIVKVYRDHGISGAKGRDERPAFNALCRAAARREFDMVMAWSVDRLGRSLQDLVGFLAELHAAKIDLYLHQQGLDTTTPAGKAMFQMMGVLAVRDERNVWFCGHLVHGSPSKLPQAPIL